MNKKRERIELLLGIRYALENGGNIEQSAGNDGGFEFCYHEKIIRQVIADIDEILNMDGITGIPADSKVGSV